MGTTATDRGLAPLVFVVGAASLGTEIAAARLLAPYFGASTIVWANTIATVLLALSVGYWVGGRVADRWPRREGLSALVVAAGVLLAIVPFIARPFLGRAADALESIEAGVAVGSLVAVMVLVAGPLLLLGAVSPYAVRLGVTHLESSGSVAGRLYAISTAGSLTGTFAAALVLIPFAGTHRTFLTFALLLTLAGALGLRRTALGVPAAVALLLALPPVTVGSGTAEGRVIYETETPYQYARVVEDDDGTRQLQLNEGLAVHSMLRPGTVLTGHYWDDFLVLPAAVLGREPRSVAILGNAGGTTARAYGRLFPRTAVDGVELDGRVTEIGRRYFDLSGPRLRLITADARPYLRETRRRYEAIFIDAYRQPYVPFYLTTREFFTLVRERLAPGGVTIINVGHPEGSTLLERALTATMRRAFRDVRRDVVDATNTLLVATQGRAEPRRLREAALPSALRSLVGTVSARLAPALGGGGVLTDDRAPVEWLVDRSILRYAAGDD